MQPLAEILRPKTLSDFIGQEHLIGKNGILTKLLNNQTSILPSLILWGPPGVGKTTLARIIAKKLNRPFFEISAVSASAKVINEIVEKNENPLIFIDEIHRFNKSQQSRLLPFVENGKVLFIGATTENPSFEVISPLLSRTRVLILKNLNDIDLKKITNKTLNHLKIKIDKRAEKFLLDVSSGDARIIINTIEIASNLKTDIKSVLELKDIEEALQKKAIGFDKNGDNFYDTISAFIKSMRSGDTSASLYYLARMVEAGQDPLYIARRMIVFASEDVASPTALVVANAVFDACNKIGYPECQENLAAGAVFLSEAKKDRRAYEGYMKAMEDVKRFGNLSIPIKLTNKPNKNNIKSESNLPEKLKNKVYYRS